MKRITMMCVLGALALGGCQEQELPTEPLGPPSDPSFTIIQRDGFHILPPVGRGHSTAGFLGTLSPRVDVCVWDGEKCEAVGHLAFFTLHAGTGDAKLQVSDDNVYEVEWDTRVVEVGEEIDFGQTYQIVVTLGGELLGTADIRFFDGGKAKSTIDEFTLKDGRTLPIRFGMTVEAVLGLLVDEVDVPATGDFVVQTFNTTDEAQKAEVPSGDAAFQVDGQNVQIPGNGDEFTLVIVEKALDANENCEAAYGGPQSGGCYVFETIPAGVTFFEEGDPELPAGLAGVCRDTTVDPEDDPFRLAKFDDGETTFPDPSQFNVVDCGGEGQIEIVLQRLPPLLRGLARALLPLPRPLHARDEGETGLVGGFSTIFWAVPLELQANPVDPFPEGPFVAGSEITLSFQLLGTHQDPQDPPEPVEGVTVQFSVTGGAVAATSAESDAAGIVSVDWDLVNLPTVPDTYTLTAFVPGTDASHDFVASVVDPPVVLVERYLTLDEFMDALGDPDVATQDFSDFPVGTPISTIIEDVLLVSSPFERLEVFGTEKILFGFDDDASTRFEGEGSYTLTFIAGRNALAFDIVSQDPDTGPIELDVILAGGAGTETFSISNPGEESDPVFIGLIASQPIETVFLKEGSEVPPFEFGSEEVGLDNFVVPFVFVVGPD